MLRHTGPSPILERGQRRIEAAQAQRELALRTTLVGVRVPARGVEHRDARSIVAPEESRRGARRLGVARAEIAALFRVTLDHVAVSHRGVHLGLGVGGRLRFIGDGVTFQCLGQAAREQRVARVKVGEARQRLVVQRGDFRG